MMRALAALLLVTALLAGCTEPPAGGGADDVDAAAHEPVPTTPPTSGSPSSPSQPPSSGGGGPSSSSGGKNGTAAGGGSGASSGANGTAATPGSVKPASPPRSWPALESAKVRPGVQVYAAGSQCTSNFVFTSPDNASVYVGVAAHCFRGAKIGDPVEFGDGGTGRLAYSSWIAMGSDGGDPTTGANAKCSIEKDQSVCDLNDFALVLVDEESEALVHPAMLHFGGPTALAPHADATLGTKVLTYGHSGLRAGIDPTNRHEGVVIAQDGWTTVTYTAPQGVPGDSGSGVLLGDGRALGILVTVHFTPMPGANGVTSLDLALAYAKEKTRVEVQLATWDLLSPGLVPV